MTPIEYSSQIIDIIKLRESLRDFVEYHLNISAQNGTPILRPMFYEFNNDIECYNAEDQYMFWNRLFSSSSLYISGYITFSLFTYNQYTECSLATLLYKTNLSRLLTL